MNETPTTLTEAAMLAEEPLTPYQLLRRTPEGREALRTLEKAIDSVMRAYQLQLVRMFQEMQKSLEKAR